MKLFIIISYCNEAGTVKSAKCFCYEDGAKLLTGKLISILFIFDYDYLFSYQIIIFRKDYVLNLTVTLGEISLVTQLRYYWKFVPLKQNRNFF